MAYESGHSSIHGHNNNNNVNMPQKHSPNFIPEDSNVLRFISKFANNYTGMINEEQWPSRLLNHLNNRHPAPIPVSHSSNRFHASMESTRQNRYGLQNLDQPQMWDFNHIPITSSGSHNSNMVYDGFNSAASNISNVINFGGSSVNNVGSTNMLSNVMNLLSPFDVNQAVMEVDTCLAGGIAPPGSVSVLPGSVSAPSRCVSHLISFSSPENSHQGESLYSNRVLPSTRNVQRSNLRTCLRSRVHTSVLNEYNKRAYEEHPVQSDNQSNKLKIPRLNSWKPVQSQPLPAADHNWRNNQSAADIVGPTSNGSWVGSGTLNEVLFGFLNRSDGNQISQESSVLQQPNSEPKKEVIDLTEEDIIESNQILKPPEVNIDTTNEVIDIIDEEDVIIESNQILKESEVNIDTENEEMKDAFDLSFEDFSTWLNQQHVPPPLPDLEPCDDFNIEDMIDNDQITEGNIDTMYNEFKELIKCPETNSEVNKDQSSQVGPQLISVPSDDYESLLDSIQPTTPIELESRANKKTTFASFDDFSESEIKKPSASLADYFSASQIKEHLSSFIKHDNNKEITTVPDGQKPCQLCSKYKKLLAPAPIYCSSCDLQVKKNAGYYRLLDENENVQYCFCKKCFNGSRKAITLFRGGLVPKANLRQAKNNEEQEDSWVQCGRCDLWQHRICGLYNDEQDKEGIAEYICFNCGLKEIENENVGPAVKTCFGAKDLPRTNLSDHIEQRLFRRMKQEREEAANFFGTTIENVPEAEGLVVRVVASVEKQLEVKQQFRDIFQGQDYPENLSYRSKLILLFQKIGGVNVCIFGIYVQEYGSECDGPNKRCVYISYLDSVKYFQPERKTASGEPLRTFVYHEILIGYLEHCKKRGFASCYIWSCPPDGNDYLFYCHPKDQKTPNEDKLRQWYKEMLKKAGKDGIVVDETNLYDEFFDPSNNGNYKITASNLPYFDGNYWSSFAESISKKIEEDQERRGGLRDKLSSKRIKDNSTKDAIVMQKLGKKIQPMKENFMIVRLQYVCTCCNEVILSGSRWSCNHCNKFHLCSKCSDDGKQPSASRTHTCDSGKNHLLSEHVLSDVPVDTEDPDDVIVNNFFADRDDFLSKCQRSQYQFDTIGHAKYSSLMILYHFSQSLVAQLT